MVSEAKIVCIAMFPLSVGIQWSESNDPSPNMGMTIRRQHYGRRNNKSTFQRALSLTKGKHIFLN